MQRAADCAEMSEEMDGYACTEGGEGKVYREIWEEKPHINMRRIDAKTAGMTCRRINKILLT